VTEPVELIQLLLDEMISPAIAEALRAHGHKVVALVERGGMRAMPDEEVFAWAAAQRSWLLTENVKDPADQIASLAGKRIDRRPVVHEQPNLPALLAADRPAG